MSSRKTLLLLIAAAFITKLLAHLFFIDSIIVWEDNATALNLFHTGEMKYFHDGTWNYNYQFPLYCYLQYIVYKLFGEHNWMIIILQLLLSSVTALLLHDIFEKFLRYIRIDTADKFARYIPLLAITGFLFHPLLIYYTIAHIHPLNMDMLMAALIIYIGLRYYENPSVFNLMFTGIVTGFALLERATLITALVPVLLLMMDHVPFGRFALRSVFILIISFIVILPYLYRNYRLTDEWKISSAAGRHLWVGSLEETEGSNIMADGRSYHYALPAGVAEKLGKMNAMQQDSTYRALYMQKLESDPASIAKMFFVKLKNFWWFRANAGETYSAKAQSFIPSYKMAYASVIMFSLIAVILLRKKSIYILSFPLALSLLQSFFYVETRHRFLIEPFLIFLALTGIYALQLSLQKKSSLRS